MSSLYVIGMAAGYVLIMLLVVKPFLKRIGDLYGSKSKLNKPVVAIFFLTLILSAYTTEIIGIHALFGAFMTGAIMPDIAKFRAIFIDKVEDVAVILLLPLFFVFTGLRTQIGLINDPFLWKVTGCIIGVAVVGKFIGSALAAKFVGQNWRDSLTIGALMNTRGLMELVVLNIGYDLGVLTSEVFTMMVIMALVTTFMTGPALDIINFIFKTKDVSPAEEKSGNSKYRILVAFGNSEKAKGLLRIASSLSGKPKGEASITAMHLSLSDELHSFNMEEYEKMRFAPVLEEAKNLKQEINTFFKATVDVETDITEIAEEGHYDLLLVGLGKSIFDGTLLGKVLGFTTRIINPDRLIDKFTGKEGLFENSPFDERTRQIITRTQMPLGIFIDKNLQKVDRVLVPIFSAEDTFLIDFCQKLISNNDSKVAVLASNAIVQSNFLLESALSTLEQEYPAHLSLMNERILDKEFLGKQDLLVISLDSWKKLVASQSTWLSNIPSVLIIKP